MKYAFKICEHNNLLFHTHFFQNIFQCFLSVVEMATEQYLFTARPHNLTSFFNGLENTHFNRFKHVGKRKKKICKKEEVVITSLTTSFQCLYNLIDYGLTTPGICTHIHTQKSLFYFNFHHRTSSIQHKHI